MPMILTPSGYKDIADCVVGDEVCAFDMVTGAPITNTIELIQPVDLTEWARWWQGQTVPPFAFVRINGNWILNSEQSVWRNDNNVCHARDLVVGDVVFDDTNNDVTITSIEEVSEPGWYRFEISGDHSYIVDGLTLHNASRFWVGGTGTWDSSTTTHWASVTNGSSGATAPGSADTATWDINSGGGTTTVNWGATVTVQSITNGAFTGTWDNSANNNNVTLSATTAFSGTGSGTRTINLGSGTYTLTSTTNNAVIWTFAVITGLTLSAASSVIDFTGSVAAGLGQTFSGGGQAYGTLRISGARFNCGLALANAGGTIATLTNTAAAYISLTSSLTITTLTQSAQLTLAIGSAQTITLTNAATLTGTAASPLAILNGSDLAISTTATITCASGTFSGTWTAIAGTTFSGGATFSFANSFDNGKNSGATITPPAANTNPVGQFISVQRGTPY